MIGQPNIAYNNRNKARILIVDDYPLVREGLIQIINKQHD